MIEKILRWVVIIGIFALPFVSLIVASSLFFPYITGKNFAFRIIVELIVAAWLALALVNVNYRPRRGWILAAFALFILVIAIADAQGANPFKSFWSNYERMDGWVTIAHLFAYFVVASVVMNSEKLWKRLFQLSLVVSLYLSVYGLLQVFGVTALGEAGASGLAARIDATFGNPIYLAVYMLFQIFIASLLWVQMRAERPRGKRMWPSVFYGSVIVLDTIALFFTGTRGTELGLIGGALLAVLLFAFFQGSKKMRNIAIASLIVVALGAFGLHAVRDTSFVKKVGFLDRLASISLSDDTVNARLMNAGIAWHGVMERPILGWGQENYAIVFDKYYDPKMYAQEPWFDRVHNIIFDWLVAGGFLGLLSYLSIFGVTLWQLWRKNSVQAYVFTLAERSILTGLLAGYFFHNLTVFDNVTSYILFGTVLAYIVWRISNATKPAALITQEILPQSAMPFTAVGAVVLASALVWLINGTAYAQNTTLLAALETGNLGTFMQAINYGTYGTQEAREQLAQLSAQVAQSTSANVTNDVKQQYYNAAVEQMTLQEKASPLDARFPLFVGTVQDAFGNYTDAGKSLELAHQLSPKKQSILFQVGLNQQAMGDMKGAEATFKQAYELDTSDNQAFAMYIAALIHAGDESIADQLLTPAVLTSGAAANQQVASAYAARNEYAKIIPIWSAYLKANPTDTAAYTVLAAAYYQSGNSAGAIATFQALAKASPSSADQANAYIAQIQSGTVKTK